MDNDTDEQPGIRDLLGHSEQCSGVLSEVFAGVADQLSGALPLALPFGGGADKNGAGEVLAAMRELERVSHLVEAAQVMLTGRIDELCDPSRGEDSLTHQTGCRNTVEVVQRVTRAGARVVSRRVRLAKRVAPRMSLIGEQLPPFAPEVARAFVAGEISEACAELVTKTLERSERIAPPEMLVAAERMMVGSATGVNGALPLHDDDMRPYCLAVGARLDQDGSAPTETCAERKRWFRLGTERDGLVPIHGELLPETAALLGRVIDAVNAPKARKPVRFEPVRSASATASNAAVSENDLSDVTVSDVPTHDGMDEPDEREFAQNVSELEELPYVDQRSGGQKRHDALMTVLETIARHPDVPLLGGAPVTVLMQVTQSGLEADHGTGWVTGHDGILEQVPLGSIRHASCAGAIQRVTQDDAGRIIELGTRDRVFNAHQRRAITLRDGGCVIPGCTIPGTWCEIHHVTEYARGGPTHTDNGVLLCWYHHRSLDTSGWAIRMNDGLPEIQAPHWVDPDQHWRRTGSPLRAPDGLRAA